MRRLKVGVVGLGPRAGIMETAVNHPAVELAALCDLALETKRQPGGLIDRLSRKSGREPELFTDYERMLGAGLDCVFVLTPPPLHAGMASRALRAGCDVVSEIPAAWTLEEARQLVAAVRDTGRRYYFAENCCYWGFVRAWKAMARQGRLGSISYAEGEYVHDLGALLERNIWEPEHGNARGKYSSWRASLDPIRYCTHETGPLLDIMDTRVSSVTAFASPSYVRPDLPAGCDLQLAVFQTASGALYKQLCAFSVTRHPPLHYYVVYGSRATLETDREDMSTLASFTDIPNLGGLTRLPLSYAVSEPPLPDWARAGHGGADGLMLMEILDSLVAGTPPPIDVYRGLDYSLPGICAVESLRNGNMKVEVPDPRAW